MVARPDGSLEVGRSLPGRGAWLCAASPVACIDLAVTRKAFARALRTEVPPAAVEGLRTTVAGRGTLGSYRTESASAGERN